MTAGGFAFGLMPHTGRHLVDQSSYLESSTGRGGNFSLLTPLALLTVVDSSLQRIELQDIFVASFWLSRPLLPHPAPFLAAHCVPHSLAVSSLAKNLSILVDEGFKTHVRKPRLPSVQNAELFGRKSKPPHVAAAL